MVRRFGIFVYMCAVMFFFFFFFFFPFFMDALYTRLKKYFVGLTAVTLCKRTILRVGLITFSHVDLYILCLFSMASLIWLDLSNR